MIRCLYRLRSALLKKTMYTAMLYFPGTTAAWNYFFVSLSEITYIEIWIYTTSYRLEKYICLLFRCYLLKIDGVVNGKRHAIEVQDGHVETLPSKYPSNYRIDLHINDGVSVLKNGIRYGYRVFLLERYASDWV